LTDDAPPEAPLGLLIDFDAPLVQSEGGTERQRTPAADALEVPVGPSTQLPLPPSPVLPEPIAQRRHRSPPIIQLFHVGMRYTRQTRALDDVSLRIDKGEFVLLTGPSGAGKTTLLKLVFCAERPTDGQLIVAGQGVHHIRRSSIPYLRRNIGVVFQDFKLLSDRSVFDNVAFALEVLGRPRRQIAPRVNAILRRVGLADKAHLPPNRLSGGEQQRVAIARALVNEPAILLADEPTGNLDPALTTEIMTLLTEANLRGTTVVVATHDPELLRRAHKRVITLDAGRLVPAEGQR
jgi:cell division transport system ATP-binding protein